MGKPARRVLALAMVSGLLVLGLAEPALAADQGDWQHGQVNAVYNCHNRGAGVMYEGDYRTSGVRCMASNLRDSYFSNDYYGNLSNHRLNDRVLNMENYFTTIRIRAYHDSNYVTPSTCIGGRIIIGPYAFGTSSGLSSFKSC